MPKKSSSIRQFTVISIISLLSLFCSVMIYYDSLMTNLQNNTCQTLDEIMEQEANSFIQRIRGDKMTLQGYAKFLPQFLGDAVQMQEALRIISENTDFEYTSYVDATGQGLNNEGTNLNVADRDYFHAAYGGETVVSEPMESVLRKANVIVVATPVWENAEIVGVLFGSYNIAKLNEVLAPSFKGYGYTYIATSEGEIIAKTESQYSLLESNNIFDLLGQADFNGQDSYETLQANLLLGGGGHSQYHYQGEDRLMHYSSLPINDWEIFSMVNPESVQITAKQMVWSIGWVCICLIFIFSGLLYYNYATQKKFTNELKKIAYVDEVTGASTFGKFKLDVVDILENNQQLKYMLVKMDIEKFTLINELYGFEMGDKVLKTLSEALKIALHDKTDAFAHIHADNFALLVSYTNINEYERKQKLFEDYFIKQCNKLIGFKIVLPKGRYRVEKGEKDFTQMFEKVNFAHKIAKKNEEKQLDFDDKVKALAVREQEVENMMEDALASGAFKMFLQPKYRLMDEKMVGAEALVRWIPETGPMLYPDEFIPLFERNGFIKKVDMYMFEQACKTLRYWLDHSILPVTISVNFSRLHLNNPDFVAELVAKADEYALPYHFLEIELTETAMFENIDTLEGIFDSIHQAGFVLSMDDFGTGYSSLGLLKNIPIDVIKIDKSFFDESEHVERGKAVIASVLEMAKRLNIHTVAEGVETQTHIDLLKSLGCETVQGYYYAKPLPLEEFQAKMLNRFLVGK